MKDVSLRDHAAISVEGVHQSVGLFILTVIEQIHFSGLQGCKVQLGIVAKNTTLISLLCVNLITNSI